MPTYQLFTVTLPDIEPTLEAVARKFGLDPSALNETYGVVEVDADASVYSIEVESDAAEAAGLPHDLAAADGESNPMVAPIEEAKEDLEREN